MESEASEPSGPVTIPKDGEKEVLGWDKKPLRTEEELKREKDLFQPVIDDFITWKATWTDAEISAQEQFQNHILYDSHNGGDTKRQSF